MLTRLCRTTLAVAAAAALVPAVADAAPRALYAISTATAPPSVEAYAVGSDGELTAIGNTSTGTDTPTDLALSPDGRFAFIALDSRAGGGVEVLRVRDDGLLEHDTRVAAGSSSTAVAVSPDGRFLYLGDYGGTVRTFSIDADGQLAAVGGPVAGPADVTDIAVSPDGGHLYVAYPDFVDPVIGTFALGADGTPSGRVDTSVSGGFGSPQALTITTAPLRLIVQDAAWIEAPAYPIAADGSLGAPSALSLGGFAGGPVAASPVGPFTFAVRDNGARTSIKTFANGASMTDVATFGFGSRIAYGGLAVSTDAGTLYVRDRDANLIRRFTVDDTGALAEADGGVAVGPTNYLTGAVVLSPDQPPAASFTAEPVNKTVALDATGSTDPDGDIVRYDWDFGDGTTLADGGPITAHDYADYGTYTVTVTETDDQGCSTQRTYTGATVSCNGGAGAGATRTVTVAPPFVPLPAAPVAPTSPSVDPLPVTPAASRVAPELTGRGAGVVRATRAGRVTLPELTAVCTAGAGPCDDAAVAVNATVRGRKVTLGKGTFSLADGQSGRIALTLPRSGRRLLAGARRLEVQAVVVLRNAATTSEARRTTTFTLLAPRRR